MTRSLLFFIDFFHVSGVCACIYGCVFICAWVHTHAQVLGVWRLTSSVLLNCSPLYFTGAGSLTKHGACSHFSQSSQPACLKILPLPPDSCNLRWLLHLPGFYVGTEDMNCNPHVCMTSTLFPKPADKSQDYSRLKTTIKNLKHANQELCQPIMSR